MSRQHKIRVLPTALVIAVGLLAAGCGGGGSDEPAAVPAPTADQGQRDETSAPDAPEAAGQEAAPTAPDPGTPARTDSPGRRPATPATTATVGSGAGGPPKAAASRVGAAPGRYRYLVSGNASGGTPPTTRQHESVSNLTVDAPSGEDQRSEQSGEQQSTETVHRYSADGTTRLVSLVLRGQFEKEFRPATPVLAMKAAPAAGDRWSWEMVSTDGTTTMHSDNEVLGDETVEVAGERLRCVEVRRRIRVTTSFNGAPITVHVDQTACESLELHLTIRARTTTDVPGFGRDESTSRLESARPSG